MELNWIEIKLNLKWVRIDRSHMDPEEQICSELNGVELLLEMEHTEIEPDRTKKK